MNKHLKIKQEREEWEKQKEDIKELVKLEEEVVSINVGGTHHIQTYKDVLQNDPNSKLF